MKLATLKNGTGVVVIDDHLVALDGVPHDVTAVLAAGPQVAPTFRSRRPTPRCGRHWSRPTWVRRSRGPRSIWR
jgi:hypothetical protein